MFAINSKLRVWSGPGVKQALPTGNIQKSMHLHTVYVNYCGSTGRECQWRSKSPSRASASGNGHPNASLEVRGVAEHRFKGSRRELAGCRVALHYVCCLHRPLCAHDRHAHVILHLPLTAVAQLHRDGRSECPEHPARLHRPPLTHSPPSACDLRSRSLGLSRGHLESMLVGWDDLFFWLALLEVLQSIEFKGPAPPTGCVCATGVRR